MGNNHGFTQHLHNIYIDITITITLATTVGYDCPLLYNNYSCPQLWAPAHTFQALVGAPIYRAAKHLEHSAHTAHTSIPTHTTQGYSKSLQYINN